MEKTRKFRKHNLFHTFDIHENGTFIFTREETAHFLTIQFFFNAVLPVFCC